MYMMEGLDNSFDAAFFVSYHGSMSSRASTLSHTYFPRAFGEVTINGDVAGEAGINALVAKAHGVPVALITGDDVTAREIDPFCPAIHCAVVKRSISRFAADSLHPDRARALIREQARLAIETLSAQPPVAITAPTTLRVQFRTSDYADLATRIVGFVRTGDLTAELHGSDALELYRSFITAVLLCRGLVE
jgi:D-amino peptidase